MKIKNFNYYEFLITYENEIPQILPFIYLFIFLTALQTSFYLLEKYY